MSHAPFFREGSGNTAVLLIHGIAGSPGHFRDLLPVIPESFTVHNILLAGHDGTPKDFGRASMTKWKQQVTEELEALFSCHEQVVIVGHSMGSLFAIQAAIDHPDRIPALFLLNVPTRPQLHVQAMIGSLQLAFGKPRSATALAMRNDTGIALSARFWEYLGWAPRMVELIAECGKVRKILPGFAVPAQVFQARSDELVSLRSCKDLTNPCIQLTLLDNSSHFVYSREDTALLRRCLSEMLQKV